jgi:BirA family biotin operon repressor/biotin-[acetyl-CoA-carboxylase] ligase
MNFHQPPARDADRASAPDPAAGRESGGAFSHGGAQAALRETVLACHLEGLAVACELVAETGSTNSDLLLRARAAAPRQPILRAAQRQTEGRGRRGRRWQGAEGGSLLFSLALPWQRSPADSSAVTLACGLAVAALVRAQLPPAPGRVLVKWPNDILLDGGKLAGILVEMAEDPSGARTLVIGLGMNLVADAALRDRVASAAAEGQPRAAPEAAPSAVLPIADLAAALGAQAVLAEREAWLARLVRSLLLAARQFERVGFEGGPAEFGAGCAYLGEAVTVHGAGSPDLHGIVRGVDAQGRLLLASARGIEALSSGELSLRPQARPLPASAGTAP